MNPIEYVWKAIEDRMTREDRQNVDTLWAGAQRAFASLSQDFIDSLYKMFNDQLREVVKRKGMQTGK